MDGASGTYGGEVHIVF